MLKTKIFVKGNVGTIEAQYTPAGKMLCKGTVAVNFGKQGSNDTDWYQFIAWENMAEWMNESVQVGTHVLLEGVQRIKKWESQDGKKGVNIEITVKDFTVLGKGKPREETVDEEQPEFMRE